MKKCLGVIEKKVKQLTYFLHIVRYIKTIVKDIDINTISNTVFTILVLNIIFYNQIFEIS